MIIHLCAYPKIGFWILYPICLYLNDYFFFFPFRINLKKKEFSRYTIKFLPQILGDIGKVLIEEWNKAGIPTKSLDNIRHAMRRMVVGKIPDDLDEIFNIAKCDHYNNKKVADIGKKYLFIYKFFLLKQGKLEIENTTTLYT